MIPTDDAAVSDAFADIAAMYYPTDERMAKAMAAAMVGLYQVRRTKGDALLNAYEAVLLTLAPDRRKEHGQ